MAKPRRKSIRLPLRVYNTPSQIFSLTICTWQRMPLFENAIYAKLLTATFHTGLFADHTTLYAYCLMPDHLHLLISSNGENLPDLIGRWKSYTANLLRKNGLNTKCWQRSFYDHALRQEEEIKTTSEYMVNNPVRAGLATCWQDYEFSWHKWMPN